MITDFDVKVILITSMTFLTTMISIGLVISRMGF